MAKSRKEGIKVEMTRWRNQRKNDKMAKSRKEGMEKIKKNQGKKGKDFRRKFSSNWN